MVLKSRPLNWALGTHPFFVEDWLHEKNPHQRGGEGIVQRQFSLWSSWCILENFLLSRGHSRKKILFRRQKIFFLLLTTSCLLQFLGTLYSETKGWIGIRKCQWFLQGVSQKKMCSDGNILSVWFWSTWTTMMIMMMMMLDFKNLDLLEKKKTLVFC